MIDTTRRFEFGGRQMKYIVIDMEWNRPEQRSRLVKEPIVLHGEIIQIGAVMLNEELDEIDSFEVKVRPKFYTRMNRKVEELTGITDKDLEDGLLFPDAINKFKDWCGKDSVLLTWGPCDVEMLEDNLIAHEMDYSWIPEEFDAQLMFDFQETMEDKNYSLDYAMYYFNLRGIKAHDALNDARDTAAVIRKLDLKDFIREERAWRRKCDEIKAVS